MAKTCRLRVVNFDEPITGDTIPDCNVGDIIKKVTNYGYKPSFTKGKVKKQKDISITVKPKKKTDKYRAAKDINCISTNELFNNCRNSNNILRSLSTKSWSLEDIKKSWKNNLNTTKIKKSNKKILENDVNKKVNNVWYRKHGFSKDDINVLFSRERSKRQKDEKKGTMISKKHPLLKRSISTLFSSSRGNYRNNTYLYYQTCHNTGLFPVPKRRKKNTESKIYDLHAVSPLEINVCKSKDQISGPTELDHFNIVGFPTRANKSDIIQTISIPQQFLCNNKPKPVEEKAVDCKGDAPVSKIENPKEHKIVNTYEKNEKFLTNVIKVKTKPLFCLCKILKSVSKSTLLAITVIVWSPCIIVMVICWFILSAFMPQEQCTQKAKTCKICPKMERDSHFKKWVACNTQRFAGMTRCIFSKQNNAITPRPLFHQLPMQILSCQVTKTRRKSQPKSGKWQPNPCKKYVLYFDNCRGWLMKPTQNQGCAHCNRLEFNEDEWGDKKSYKKDKSVTFWDTEHSKPCKCDHSAANTRISECIQTTCQDPETKFPMCRICQKRLEDNLKHKLNQIQKSKSTLRPCPIATPCPSRSRKDLALINKISKQIAQAENRQASNVIKLEVIKKNVASPESEPSVCKGFVKQFVCCGDRIWRGVDRAEEEAWGDGVDCDLMFLDQLRRNKFCRWVYRRHRKLYSLAVAWNDGCMKLYNGFMFILATCIWCPLFFCCYITYKIICLFCT